MKPETLRWIEAAKVLAEDPEAKVRCPKNEDGFLEVRDVADPADGERFERHLVCPECGATNILLMHRPAPGSSTKA